jgi:hypothetical protein
MVLTPNRREIERVRRPPNKRRWHESPPVLIVLAACAVAVFAVWQTLKFGG